MNNQDRNINHFLKKTLTHILSKKYPWIKSVELESHSEVKNEAFVFILETTFEEFQSKLLPNQTFAKSFSNERGMMILDTDLKNYISPKNLDTKILVKEIEYIKKLSKVEFLFKFAIWIEPTIVQS